jgi:parallel beta-helix repeat protein
MRLKKTPPARVLFIYLVVMAGVLSSLFSGCKKDAMVEPTPTVQVNDDLSQMSLAATVATTGLTHDQWVNVAGNNVSDIPLTTAPSSTTTLSTLELANTTVANTGDRIRGYITAPTTGDYTFWIAGDDAAELWLSTDATTAKAVKIASFLSWTNFRQWDKYSSQQSKAIKLTAGTKYYIEVLHKQGGGNGSVSVQWKLPNGTYETPIPASRLTPYTTAAVTPTGLLHEEWTNVAGNDVSDIPLTTTANSTTDLSNLELPNTTVVNTGDRIRGYITAPTTGSYTFWVAGDDAAELWLSTDATSAKAVKIASFLSWTNFRQWDKFSSQESKAIKLTAGTKYYIEVLHKQGGGNGSLSVQWKLPNGTYETPIPADRLTPFVPTAAATTTTAISAYTASGVINLTNQHDITISGKAIAGGNVPCITLTNCYNITINNCKLYNSTDVGIHEYKCYNVTVENSYFTNVASGVYAEQTTNGGIVVINDQFLNMVGPYPRGQFIQFNNVNGAGNSVTNNKGENILGQSQPEDAISMYQSNGTSSSPIMISGNWIRGGGPSSSGGGIMLGDEGGSYLTAENNILVNPGEYGIAISGGDHNSLINNTVYGASQYFTNVGLYVNSINGYTVTNGTVTGNKILFYNSSNYANNCWLAPGTNKPTGWDTANTWGAASLTSSILPSLIITDK